MTSTNVESATPGGRRPSWIDDAERLDLAIYAGIARSPTPALDVAMSRLSRAADYSRLSLTSSALLAFAAFAFATGVGNVSPAAATPLRALAALVAYSRVHTGVHYPADVLAGALIGTALAQLTTHVLAHRRRGGAAGAGWLAQSLDLHRLAHGTLQWSGRGGGRSQPRAPPGQSCDWQIEWSSPRWYEIETIRAGEPRCSPKGPSPGFHPPSSSSRSRPPAGWPNSCRFVTGGCSCRRSRSSAVPRTRWRPTCPPSLVVASRPRRASRSVAVDRSEGLLVGARQLLGRALH